MYDIDMNMYVLDRHRGSDMTTMRGLVTQKVQWVRWVRTKAAASPKVMRGSRRRKNNYSSLIEQKRAFDKGR